MSIAVCEVFAVKRLALVLLRARLRMTKCASADAARGRLYISPARLRR